MPIKKTPGEPFASDGREERRRERVLSLLIDRWASFHIAKFKERGLNFCLKPFDRACHLAGTWVTTVFNRRI